MNNSNFGMGSVSEMMQPFGAFAEMQRQSLEQARQATHEGFKLQKQFMHTAVEGVESQQPVHEKNSELTRTSIESTVSAIEESMQGADQPPIDIQEMVRDQFDVMDDMSDQTWETFHESMEENVDAYEALVDQYAAFFDNTFGLYIESIEEMSADSDGEPHHDTQ